MFPKGSIQKYYEYIEQKKFLYILIKVFQSRNPFRGKTLKATDKSFNC